MCAEKKKELRRWRKNKEEESIRVQGKEKRIQGVVWEKEKRGKWEAEQVRRERDVWRIVNRGRKRGRKVTEEIEIKE